MNHLLIITVVAGGIAGIVILRVFAHAVRAWLQLQSLRKRGIETTARILHVEVMDKADRHIPFVKLQVEIQAAAGHCFVTEAESFFPRHKLSTLASDKPICIRYNPKDISQVQVIKAPLPLHTKVLSWHPIVQQPRYQWLN
jgi:hypothetical protein